MVMRSRAYYIVSTLGKHGNRADRDNPAAQNNKDSPGEFALNLFAHRSRSLLGLDISSSAVKLLELGRHGDAYRVESYGADALPPGAVVEKQIADPELVGQAIGRVLKMSGTRNRDAAVAVAGSSIITKIIQMPATLREEELEQQIQFEADQYIPYPVNEVNLDFQVMGQSDRDPDLADVLLAACRSDTIEMRVAALEIAGLKARVVDVEAYALENASELLAPQMPDQGRGRTIAIVDLGATTTSTIILHDLETIYTRDQLFGGQQLTEEIMRRYGLALDEAGKAKKFGRLPDNYDQEVLPAFIEDMAQQIDRALQFFFSSHTSHDVIDQLILAGGCANVPNAASEIERRIEIPTMLAQPFQSMTVSSRVNVSKLNADATSMMIACGLSLRSFD